MTGKARDNFTSHTQRLGHANCAGTQERREIPHMWSYKVTVNQVLAVEEYPLPTPEELFSTLSRGKLFSLPVTGLPSATSSERVKAIPDNQHSSRTVRLQSSTLWSSFSSCYFSKING